MIGMLTSLIVVIISKWIHISKYLVIHLKYIQHLFVNFTLDKLEKVRTVNKLIHNTLFDSEVNNTDIITVRQTPQIHWNLWYTYTERIRRKKRAMCISKRAKFSTSIQKKKRIMSETEKVENKNISLIFRIEVETRRNIWIKIRRGVGSVSGEKNWERKRGRHSWVFIYKYFSFMWF